MILGRCEVTNFGSFKELEFDFRNKGLTLVSGATGSGKSTLLDIAPWILYGTTAKDGNVDEIRSWFSPGEPTTGHLDVYVGQKVLKVTRVRGSNKENDLYWTEDDLDEKRRGKDLADTQRLLDSLLFISSELFLTSSYFHEFSKTSSFFSSKAKDRREVFDSIANLSLPIRLDLASKKQRAEVKKVISGYSLNVANLTGQMTSILSEIKRAEKDKEGWDEHQKGIISSLETCYLNFEDEKLNKIKQCKAKNQDWTYKHNQEIEKLDSKIKHVSSLIEQVEPHQLRLEQLKKELKVIRSTKCTVCGGPKRGHELDEILDEIAEVEKKLVNNQGYVEALDNLTDTFKELSVEVSPFLPIIEEAEGAKNHYGDRLQAERNKSNPHEVQTVRLTRQHEVIKGQLDKFNKELEDNQDRFDALLQIQYVAEVLKTELLKKAVCEIETSTNNYLDKYFDAEIRVAFKLQGADSLDVEIQKSGYPCVYKQLSKGQRQLLKLCFSVSVMSIAANNAGVHFDTIFMDEALDGMDTNLKVKAFSLFEELSLNHESIFLIDHSEEFKQLFSNQLHVELVSDNSLISKGIYE